MEWRGLSQGDLARLVGVSTATAWAWLHGSVPQRRTAEVLCQKLDVLREWLIFGRGKRDAYFKTKDDARSADTYLAILEKFEEIDLITLKKEAASRAFKSAAKDIRKITSRIKTETPQTIIKMLLALANHYDAASSDPPEEKREIRLHAKGLTHRLRKLGM
jgi:transcriptional regulator with XRE-family HTH domain